VNNVNDFVDYMFKVPLLHLQVRNWKKKKEILLEMVNNSNLIIKGDNVKSDYHTQNDNQTMGEHNNSILEVLKEEIEIFCNYFKFNYYEITESWFETAKKGNDHAVHNHGATGYSCVCYVDYIKDAHTPTQFVSPFNNFLTGTLLQYISEVEEGSIIFFPSVIMHYTKPNNSKIERTILSFNLDVNENELQ